MNTALNQKIIKYLTSFEEPHEVCVTGNDAIVRGALEAGEFALSTGDAFGGPRGSEVEFGYVLRPAVLAVGPCLEQFHEAQGLRQEVSGQVPALREPKSFGQARAFETDSSPKASCSCCGAAEDVYARVHLQRLQEHQSSCEHGERGSDEPPCAPQAHGTKVADRTALW